MTLYISQLSFLAHSFIQEKGLAPGDDSMIRLAFYVTSLPFSKRRPAPRGANRADVI